MVEIAYVTNASTWTALCGQGIRQLYLVTTELHFVRKLFKIVEFINVVVFYEF